MHRLGLCEGVAKAGLLLYAPGRRPSRRLPRQRARRRRNGDHDHRAQPRVRAGGRVGAGAATDLQPVQTLLGCGSTTTLKAVTPAGTAGSSVPVTVQTAQSVFTHRAGTSSARFSYR